MPTRPPKGRGAGVRRPPEQRYTAAEWIKGYSAWLLVLPFYAFLLGFATVFKRVPDWMLRKLLRMHNAETQKRRPDVRIPGDWKTPAYMLRWWRIPRNAFFNIYYHNVLRSDDDRALHDHPWWNFSIVLEGGYYEHCINAGGVNVKTWYPAGSVRFRRAGTFAHRLELVAYHAGGLATAGGNVIPVEGTKEELPVKTIFITGPTLRRWGFHHPERWVDAYEWDNFCQERGIGGMKMGGYAEQLNKARTE